MRHNERWRRVSGQDALTTAGRDPVVGASSTSSGTLPFAGSHLGCNAIGRGWKPQPPAPTALGMLADVEAIDRHKASAAIALMDRVGAMTWKLIGS